MEKKRLAAINRGIAALGGFVKTAARFKITPAALQHWRTRGVPIKHLREFSDASGVPIEDLNPELFK
jgi:hypothetical protein